VAQLSTDDVNKLQRLEEALWHEDTRYDVGFMEQVLATDFIEFGRSGRTYQRSEIINSPKRPINAVFPLQSFTVRPLSDNVALVTYNSQVAFHGQCEYGRRSSIWSRLGDGWVLRFHQGTPYDASSNEQAKSQCHSTANSSEEE